MPQVDVETLIPDEAAQRIIAVADADPMIELGGAHVNFEFCDSDGRPTGEVEHRYFEIDRTPHAPQFTYSARRCIPHEGISICNHRSMNKLDDLERKRECYQALAKEYCGLDDRGLWRCVPLPTGAVCHPVLVHIKCKRDPNGNFICVKGRLCVRGDKMVSGRDHGLVYAPTAQLRTARCEIAMAVAKDYCCKAIDVSQAFTFGYPSRRTFIDIPPGRSPPSAWSQTGKWCMELVRNLYGVPDAPRRWHIEIHNEFLHHGFCPSASDPCLFVKGDLRVMLFVDDCLSTYPNTKAGIKAYTDFIAMLQREYKLQDDGMSDATAYLGMRIDWAPWVNGSRAWARITCPGAIEHHVKSSNFDGCKITTVPAVPKSSCMLNECPPEGPEGNAERAEVAGYKYRARVGELLWISRVARPDISHAVNDLARVAHNPGMAHVRAVQHVSRYLSSTADMGLQYNHSPDVNHAYPVGWTDASYAPNYCDGEQSKEDNYRSTSAYVFTCNGTAVSWRSRRQPILATSSCDSETYAAAAAAKEAMHLRRLLAVPGTASPPIVLLGDNKSTITAANNGTDKDKSKHIDVSAHFLRGKCREGSICFYYVPGTENISDLFSKNLAAPLFSKFRAGMGVC